MALCEFLSHGAAIEEVMYETFSKYSPRITTITSYFNIEPTLNIRDIHHLMELYENNKPSWNKACYDICGGGDYIHIRVPGSSRKDMIRKKDKIHISFYNSISLVYTKTKRKICCKLFKSGFHITGCESFQNTIDIVEMFKHFLFELIGTHVQILHSTIQLTNILFNLGKEIDIDKLTTNIISRKYDIRVLYDIERYCGLRLKIGTCTFLLFPSGKGMLTGIKKGEDIRFVSNYFCLITKMINTQ